MSLHSHVVPLLGPACLWSSIFRPEEGVAGLKARLLIPAVPAAPVKVLPLLTGFLLITVFRVCSNQSKTSCLIPLNGNFIPGQREVESHMRQMGTSCFWLENGGAGWPRVSPSVTYWA